MMDFYSYAVGFISGAIAMLTVARWNRWGR